ncbi:zf-HC2 domain-containing protein [Microbacterium atlanticum]|uniref:zf-HC2 domain-containing protein n=1 Tax=Microbacterium atlanticum TaxID=2782168 RepID=UPI0018878826|nr:zf-HC2 domain-containing protein [Microbacterium atlanticum]
MTSDHARFADWDAAYLVRALTSDDRARYEAHLEDCPLCRAALSELAPTLGLLARVPADRAGALLDPVDGTGPDPAARARVVARGARDARRRRTRAWVTGLAAAAAVAIVAAVAIGTALRPGPRLDEVLALEPVADVSLSATVELAEVAWGTRIEMVCHYPPSRDPYAEDREWPYVLVVTAADGTTSELSSWRAAPGTTARLEAGTALDPDEIAAIEVRAVPDGRVLLRGEPAGPSTE